MKRIEVSLNVGMIAPLLDFLRPVLQELEHETAFASEMAEADRELAGLWREGLIHTQVDDCRALMKLFDAEFLNSGQITLTEENADRVLRATSAIRMRLRTGALARISDDAIRSGTVNLGACEESERTAYAALALMRQIQEIVLEHLVK
jgi:hypothetical protein